MRRPDGFTVLEVLVALLVWAIGLFCLALEMATLTRQRSRAARAELVSTSTAARLERLQSAACLQRSNGGEPVVVGGTTVATLQWNWDEGPPLTYRVQLVAMPTRLAAGLPVPADTTRAVIACDR
jgi:Tfp pilus assembly protein PilV